MTKQDKAPGGGDGDDGRGTGVVGRFLRAYPDFLLRAGSAIALLPVALFALWAGGLWFLLLALVAAGLCFWEWSAIIGVSRRSLASLFGYGLLVVVAALLYFGRAQEALGLVAAGTIVVGMSAGINRVGRWFGEGFVYAALALVSIYTLRMSDHGLGLVFYLMVVVWVTDVGAYIVGRSLGGPKLWPAISPGKTWSGALGGLLLGSLGGLVAAWLVLPDAGIGAFLLGALLSALSQGGDLFESALKRRFGVKDSSHLIPGHGGMLDRIDGLVAASVAAYVLAVLLGGALGAPGAALLQLF
ncbi:phosphatidate cytidylyltransferase [Polycladidibacter hongkongensis]|uniref:phosphatidate cytidylyltransferase n=1 Tax=Polycladidibacter hongkongensis TaxID=1647556 RepID=UPI00082CAD4B|nr:phosphatidate cytidylyltransferase [Pseudovibrio hongkongensis]